jgi:hypothetical protein
MVSSNYGTISPTQHRRAIGYTMFQSAIISIIDSFTFAGHRRHCAFFHWLGLKRVKLNPRLYCMDQGTGNESV